MQKIIEIIEAKLKDQEETISFQKWQISDLTAKLEKAEETIEAQADIISDLKGEKK